jgi:hypothetical protein
MVCLWQQQVSGGLLVTEALQAWVSACLHLQAQASLGGRWLSSFM